MFSAFEWNISLNTKRNTNVLKFSCGFEILIVFVEYTVIRNQKRQILYSGKYVVSNQELRLKKHSRATSSQENYETLTIYRMLSDFLRKR